MTDRLEFIEQMKSEKREKFRLPGVRIGSFARQVPYESFKPSQFTLDEKRPRSKNALENRNFDVVKVKGGTDYFKMCDRRFQALFQFYIDGASFIDDDSNWNYFIVFLGHRVVGFTSVLEDEYQRNAPWQGVIGGKARKNAQ